MGTLALAVLLLACAPAYAQMYKCVDQRGVTHYSDKPLPRAHGAGVHEEAVHAARRQARREPRPAARGVARAGSRLCVTRRTPAKRLLESAARSSLPRRKKSR